MNTNIDIEFLRQTAGARRDVGKWLNERPNVGLDVTDVATLVAGFDYLVDIIKQLTGEDLNDYMHQQIGESNMQITFLD